MDTSPRKALFDESLTDVTSPPRQSRAAHVTGTVAVAAGRWKHGHVQHLRPPSPAVPVPVSPVNKERARISVELAGNRHLERGEVDEWEQEPGADAKGVWRRATMEKDAQQLVAEKASTPEPAKDEQALPATATPTRRRRARAASATPTPPQLELSDDLARQMQEMSAQLASMELSIATTSPQLQPSEAFYLERERAAERQVERERVERAERAAAAAAEREQRFAMTVVVCAAAVACALIFSSGRPSPTHHRV